MMWAADEVDSRLDLTWACCIWIDCSHRERLATRHGVRIYGKIMPLILLRPPLHHQPCPTICNVTVIAHRPREEDHEKGGTDEGRVSL